MYFLSTHGKNAEEELRPNEFNLVLDLFLDTSTPSSFCLYFSFMEEQVVINARVSNRTYKIKVSPRDEEHVREQLNQIADKLHQFKLNFPGRDEQDYMAMVLLEYVTTHSGNKTGGDLSSIEQELQKISNLLDQ